MSQVNLDTDMLGIVAWLSQSAFPSSCHWLRFVYLQIPSDEVSAHLCTIALDNLSASKRKMFIEYACSYKQLSKADTQYFRDIGFIFGVEPTIPQALKKLCNIYVNIYY